MNKIKSTKGITLISLVVTIIILLILAGVTVATLMGDNGLINKTKDEVQEEYENWEIEEFSSEKIVLKQEYNKECGEHYILKDNDGIIAVYQINEEGKEELLDETEIATEYLAQDDLTKIQKGLRINGKKELNKILEDFE